MPSLGGPNGVEKILQQFYLICGKMVEGDGIFTASIHGELKYFLS